MSHKIAALGFAGVLALASVFPAGGQAPVQPPPPPPPSQSGLTAEQSELLGRLAADLKEMRAQVGRLPDGQVRQQMLQTVNRLDKHAQGFARLTSDTARDRMAIPTEDLAKLLKALKSETFDEKRLPVLKLGIVRTNFTAEQARGLVNAFAYSDGKKRAALMLYPHLLDPNNFTTVLNALPYGADRDDVIRAIGPKR